MNNNTIITNPLLREWHDQVGEDIDAGVSPINSLIIGMRHTSRERALISIVDMLLSAAPANAGERVAETLAKFDADNERAIIDSIGSLPDEVKATMARPTIAMGVHVEEFTEVDWPEEGEA